ncbi:MAG: NrfD/PsrC family molybdoenzyme membrane anchor subunit [Alphaproteobacteria bacterium]
MLELAWGLPVIGYLFLAGVGAGALTVSSSVLLRGGSSAFGDDHMNIARWGALAAPPLMIIGTGMIIFELGTFQAAIENGEFWRLFRFIRLFLTINLSPMSIGSWVLGVTILASLVYAYTFLVKGDAARERMSRLRRGLAWIGVPLGISVAIYTGVMLGAMPARPFWNSPVLTLLFLISSMSTGVAVILLLRAVFGATPSAADSEPIDDAQAAKSAYLLASSDTLLIGFEILAIFLFIMFALITIGNPARAMAVILPGGDLAGLFWIGVVLIGLILPVLVELRYVIPTLLRHRPFAMPRGVEIAVCLVVLIGGFMLRYVVVIAGQVTGPVGI